MDTIEIAEVQDIQEDYITDDFRGVEIYMRESDGFIDAMSMEKVNADRRWDDYIELAENKKYFDAAVQWGEDPPYRTRTPIVVKNYKYNGIIVHRWVHVYIAIHFATWIDPEFGISMIAWIEHTAEYHNDSINKFVQTVGDEELKEDNEKLETQKSILEAEVATHKEMIETLKKEKAELQDFVDLFDEEINHIVMQSGSRCVYCNTKCSSRLNLLSHLKKCSNKNRYKGVIDLDRFVTYLELLSLNSERVFDTTIGLTDRAGSKPKLIINRNNKEYVFNIFHNESRWKVIKFLEDDVVFPIEPLLTSNSLAMFHANKDIYEYLRKLYTIDATLEYELTETIEMDNNEVDDDDGDSESNDDIITEW